MIINSRSRTRREKERTGVTWSFQKVKKRTAAAGFTLTDWELNSIRLSSITSLLYCRPKEIIADTRSYSIRPLGLLLRQKRNEMKWIQKASGDNIYIVMATRRALTSANHLVKLTVYSYEYDLILTCVRLRLSSRSMIRKWNFVFSYKWNGRIIRNATQCMSQFDFDCIASLPACLPACACIEHGEKERSWKRESKVVNLLFTISRLDSNLFLLYQKKRKKKRRKIWRLLAHSFIHFFCSPIGEMLE